MKELEKRISAPVKELMGKDPESESFIENILLQNRLLELQVKELESEVKKLERANKDLRKLVEKIIGPMKKDRLPIIRIRTIRSSEPQKPRKSRPYPQRRLADQAKGSR